MIVTTTDDYTIRDQERMKLAGNYFEWQCRMALPHLGKRVLEIGCGTGNFTRHLGDREMVVGIDIVKACVKEHGRRLGHHANITALHQDVLDPAFLELKQYRPDSVVCLNVLEHIGDDAQALRNMHSVLPDGARAVLIVPAFEALYGPIDAKLGHFRRYSKRTLGAVAREAGFRLQTLRYFNSIGWFGWWVNAHILKRVEQSEAQIVFFDSKIVPTLSRLEDRFEPPFGQSIFAVLVKGE